MARNRGPRRAALPANRTQLKFVGVELPGGNDRMDEVVDTVQGVLELAYDHETANGQASAFIAVSTLFATYLAYLDPAADPPTYKQVGEMVAYFRKCYAERDKEPA